MADINQTFKIYNADGTQFNGLELKKSTYTSVAMSLDDKIEGDVFYKDNSLSFTFKEYVVYNNVNYYLKLDNPPTIVRKGMMEDNGDLKGMTKYSLTFYHPMVWLNSIPFTDIAVSNDEKKYKSEDTTFAWVGTISDLVTKINKNLQGTNWTCALQTGFIDNGTQSDILSFDNQKISDVLKTCYETFKVPFTIDGYSIKFGAPSNEIKNEDGSNFIFKLGQGLGLKNNDRTPKNNQIITRIAGYGSNENIPFGYPKIKWTGNPQWNYTINNDANAVNSYPIIDGTIDGESVRLINHPFTRSVLMPTVYVDSVNKKVNPNASGYNPNTTLVDYYDAIDDATHTYINHINTASPSYDKHQFDKIKPSIVGAKYNNQRIDMIKSITPCDANGNDATYWDDSTDDEGNYKQSYFKIELYPLGFDLYAMASVTSEMSVNMTSGACNGCKFNLGVDWDDVKNNFYVTDENGKIIFTPDGDQRDYTKYPDSTASSIKIILQKDTSTFGILMPSIYQQPIANDTFVFIGIEMPQIYITNTQKTLDESMKQYMLENNVAYYEYPFDFDEYFLKTHQYILNQIKPNSIIRFKYVNDTFALSVKELAITYGDKPLPTYKITLTDDVSLVINQLGQLVSGLSQLGSQVAGLQAYYGDNIIKEINKKISKYEDDTAYGNLTLKKGFKSESLVKIGDAIDSFVAGKGVILTPDGRVQADTLEARYAAVFREIVFNRLSAQEGDVAYSDNGLIDSLKLETDGTYTLTLRKRWENDFTSFQEDDIIYGEVNNLFSDGTYYTSWMRVASVNTTANTISAILYQDSAVPSGKNHVPVELMRLVKRGNANATKKSRQSYWYLSATEEKCFVWLEGVNKPIIEENNYYMMLGRPKNLSLFTNLPINYNQAAVFARAGIFQNIFRVKVDGTAVVDLLPAVQWVSGTTYKSSTTEVDTVWNYGCRWQCIVASTTQEPKYGATDWVMIEGNPNFTIDIESSNMYEFGISDIADGSIFTTLSIKGTIYNRDCTDSILDADVSWTRDSGNVSEDNTWAALRANAGKSLTLTKDDLGVGFPNIKSMIYKATVTLRDGQTAENELMIQ